MTLRDKSRLKVTFRGSAKEVINSLREEAYIEYWRHKSVKEEYSFIGVMELSNAQKFVKSVVNGKKNVHIEYKQNANGGVVGVVIEDKTPSRNESIIKSIDKDRARRKSSSKSRIKSRLRNR
jgi:hypothetical protein